MGIKELSGSYSVDLVCMSPEYTLELNSVENFCCIINAYLEHINSDYFLIHVSKHVCQSSVQIFTQVVISGYVVE